MQNIQRKLVCHMLVTLDGKTNGDAFLSEDYTHFAKSYCDAAVKHFGDIKFAFVGRGTIGNSINLEENLPQAEKGSVPREDYTEPLKEKLPPGKRWMCIMDSKGTVASKTNVVEMKGSGYNYFDGDRIVEVVSKNGVSDSFLTHLRKVGIPYIFAGEDSVDSGVAFHKMCECLGEKQGFVFGGATLNGSFLKQGLVTDVSLLQVPAFSNNDKDLPLFNPTEGKFPPLFLNLVASESVGRGGTWLHYALDKKE